MHRSDLTTLPAQDGRFDRAYALPVVAQPPRRAPVAAPTRHVPMRSDATRPRPAEESPRDRDRRLLGMALAKEREAMERSRVRRLLRFTAKCCEWAHNKAWKWWLMGTDLLAAHSRGAARQSVTEERLAICSGCTLRVEVQERAYCDACPCPMKRAWVPSRLSWKTELAAWSCPIGKFVRD